MAGRSKVVFVGNIPYDMAEEQLIGIFSEVGPVAGFRLVFDRDTGKPKGYGFCEFHDPETAASAVRNLNDVDVGGRSLRIDWADVDPMFQGRTTQMGQIDGELPKRGTGGPPPQRGPTVNPPIGGMPAGGQQQQQQQQQQQGPPQYNMNNLPQGTPLPPGKSATDAITDTLATLPPNQLLDVMSQIKSLVLQSPKDAQGLLSSHPQLTYALFQAMLMMNLVDPAILQRTLAGSGAVGPVPQQQQQQMPPQQPPFGGQQQFGQRPPPPPPMQYGQQQPQQQQRYPPPPPQQQQQQPPYGLSRPPQPPSQQPYSNTPPSMHQRPPPPPPPHNLPYGQQQQQQQPSYGTPPTGFPPANPFGGLQQQNNNAELPDSQKQLLNQVLSLSDSQIAALPAEQRNSIMMLRKQYGK